MASDDDIAAFLPTPRQPAPARRQAAIDAAMRRFDGQDAAPRVAAGGRGTLRPAFWTSPRRGLAGAALTAALVALIGGPVAWHSLHEPAAVQSGQPHSAPAPAASQPNPTELAGASPIPPAASRSAAAPPAAREPPVRATTSSNEDAAAASAEPAAPPPPARPTEMADARPIVTRASAKAAASASEARNVAARMAAPPAAAAPLAEAEARTENDNASVVVTGTRVRAIPRGDWNACTVDDPARSLSKCRKQVDRAYKRPAAAAAVQVSEGLSRAWEGDTDAAIAAFDRAIAIAPKSALAYLNRGLAWRRNGDLGRALADLDQAVKLAPREARTYYNRSLVLRAQGAAARARRDEERALDLDPRYGDVVR